MVLEKGEVVEYGTPTVLMSNRKSHLYYMAKEAGLV